MDSSVSHRISFSIFAITSSRTNMSISLSDIFFSRTSCLCDILKSQKTSYALYNPNSIRQITMNVIILLGLPLSDQLSWCLFQTLHGLSPSLPRVHTGRNQTRMGKGPRENNRTPSHC